MNINAFKHFAFDDDYAFRSWASLGGHRLAIKDPSLEIDGKWLDD